MGEALEMFATERHRLTMAPGTDAGQRRGLCSCGWTSHVSSTVDEVGREFRGHLARIGGRA